jgi:hypothetical protein
MPVTQFEFPEKYEYLVGLGLYHQYADHRNHEPVAGSIQY